MSNSVKKRMEIWKEDNKSLLEKKINEERLKNLALRQNLKNMGFRCLGIEKIWK